MKRGGKRGGGQWKINYKKDGQGRGSRATDKTSGGWEIGSMGMRSG